MFPDKPITKKPQETRMGKGKGAPDQWVAVIKPGRILYEMEGVPEKEAREALRLAAHKLSIKTKFVKRLESEVAVMKSRQAPRDERRRAAGQGAASCRSSSSACASRSRIGQLDNALKIRETRRDIARVKTVLQAEAGPGRRPRPAGTGDAAWRDDERREAAPTRRRNEQVGVVVKAKMQKTVVVAVERLVRHAMYRKTIKRTSTFMAHDEKGAKQGDTRAHRGDPAPLQEQALAGGGDPDPGHGDRGRRLGAEA